MGDTHFHHSLGTLPTSVTLETCEQTSLQYFLLGNFGSRGKFPATLRERGSPAESSLGNLYGHLSFIFSIPSATQFSASSPQLSSPTNYTSTIMNSIRNSGPGTGSASNLKASILKTKSDASFNGGDFSDFNMLTMAAAAASSYDSSRSTPPKRRKQDPKTGKGLRHFSMKVS